MDDQKYGKSPTVEREYSVRDRGKPQDSRRWEVKLEVTERG